MPAVECTLAARDILSFQAVYASISVKLSALHPRYEPLSRTRVSGLSGTGPKAGGPNYLDRFVRKQVVTVNTAASGGNATLLAEEE
jgi:hypothetical protein